MPLGLQAAQLNQQAALAQLVCQLAAFNQAALPYWSQTNTASSTNTIWFSGTTTSCTATFTPVELVIDEEEYVNHREYFELARSRGVAFRVRTAEERRQAAAAEVARRVAAAEREQVRAAADARALGLLLENLTATQRDTYEKNGWFVVTGGRSGARYRIRDKTLIGNVDVLDGDRVTHRLCAHAPQVIPMGDQLLAQKLTIEFDEDEFLRKANRHAA